MSFGIWYGKEHCEAKGLDPEIVMTSFEFLEKE